MNLSFLTLLVRALLNWSTKITEELFHQDEDKKIVFLSITCMFACREKVLLLQEGRTLHNVNHNIIQYMIMHMGKCSLHNASIF